MTHDTTHNGWSNYATWRINLEICDDLVSHLCNDIEDDNVDPFNDVSEMADSLSEEVDNILSNYGNNDRDAAFDLVLSYARAFVSDVNFYEIAESAIEDNPELIVQDDTCSECGADLDDGEGYDGLCGTCADKAEATT